MRSLIASDRRTLIVGGGATGLSVARFLHARGQSWCVYDTREDESVLAPFKAIDPDVRAHCGTFDPSWLSFCHRVIVSPGVSLKTDVIRLAREAAIPVKGDVAVFLDHVRAPVIGITGSNGKSSVTTMVGLVAEAAGIDVAVGGNLGTPALDLLDRSAALYVLEISSFQLESISHAGLDVAANLNLSPDHLDRHGSMAEYFRAKQKIFFGAQHVVYNLHDPLTQPPTVKGVQRYGFGIKPRSEVSEMQFTLNEQGLLNVGGCELIDKNLIKQPGLHNVENVLAVYAIAEAAGLPLVCVNEVVSQFPGLPHRCELVAEKEGRLFINDSKATNIGATLAALRGLADEGRPIALIAGGEGKGADFTALAEEIRRSVACLVLIGKAAEAIAEKVANGVLCLQADSMAQAVALAARHGGEKALVLLSPACASFDMYRGFEHRGEVFRDAVAGWAA